jgi:DNA-binding transcriptional LysR family regulator
MPEPFRIQQIRQFVITATTGSFRAAATGTFRSQAAVSAAMRDLERQVGGKLFETGRRAKLTALAQALLPVFQDLLATHDRVAVDVRHLAQAERGPVSVAVVPFLSDEWLSKVLIDFTEKHPDVRVLATDQRSHQVRGLVADGSVDIGVAGILNDDPKLSFRAVATDSFGILCAKEHPMAQARRAPWSALHGVRLIGSDVFELLKGAGLGAWIEDPVMTVTSRTALIGSVRANAGVTVMPRLTGPHDMAGFAFVPLERPRITRTIGLITRRGQTLLPAAAAMHDWMLRSLVDYCRDKGADIVGPDPRPKAKPPKTAQLRRDRNPLR